MLPHATNLLKQQVVLPARESTPPTGISVKKRAFTIHCILVGTKEDPVACMEEQEFCGLILPTGVERKVLYHSAYRAIATYANSVSDLDKEL